MKSSNGLPGGTRTPDLLLRRQLLYPVELLAVGLQPLESAPRPGLPMPAGMRERRASYQCGPKENLHRPHRGAAL